MKAFGGIAEACGAGLRLDPVARARGRADGETGTFSLTEDDILGRGAPIDALAYSGGFLEGAALRRKRG